MGEGLARLQAASRHGRGGSGSADWRGWACNYVEATLEEFLSWNSDQSSISGAFRDYDHSKFWAYADYKYFVSLFEDKTDIFQVSQYISFSHGIICS